MGCLQDSIEKLHRDFDAIVWQYPPEEAASVRTQLWPGSPAEDVMLCVYKGRSIQEPFHRQDYFFFNFAYQGDYGALSARFDHRITVRENECYIGQPYAGYAINGQSETEILLEQRMERAVALLRGTTLPISEIAALLGYSNASNFYKAFRKQYHLSPREYLQQ